MNGRMRRADTAWEGARVSGMRRERREVGPEGSHCEAAHATLNDEHTRNLVSLLPLPNQPSTSAI